MQLIDRILLIAATQQMRANGKSQKSILGEIENILRDAPSCIDSDLNSSLRSFTGDAHSACRQQREVLDKHAKFIDTASEIYLNIDNTIKEAFIC